jgi:uncharacterized protein YecE (DUF72 family)
MATRKKARIRVGIGGWTFEPWRGTFYPDDLTQKRELEYASRALTSIEVNGTFYGSQKPETFAKWRDETPDDFVFSLKAPRYATNRRVLAEAGETIERFFAGGVLELGDKLGPINWQFAPTKKFDADDFGAFLALLPSKVDGRAIRHAVEVRHESFADASFVRLCRKYKVAIVLAGDSDHPQIADVTAPFVYARIMGTSESQKLGYSKAQLDVWADRMRGFASGSLPEGLSYVFSDSGSGSGSPAAGKAASRDVFVYVISGDKVRNPLAAQALIERLDS